MIAKAFLGQTSSPDDFIKMNLTNDFMFIVSTFFKSGLPLLVVSFLNQGHR